MKLALGTAQFGLKYGIANQDGQITRTEAKKMLEFAAMQGIDTIDTAIDYGDSEESLGEIGIQSMQVITKLPPLPDVCDDISLWVNHQIFESLRRLGCRELHGLILHRPKDLLGVFGHQLYEAIQKLKRESLVRKIGVSIYSPAELNAITSQFVIDIVQAPFNVVDQRLLTTGWLDRLKNEGVEIHTRSSFLQGLLLMPRNAIPEQFSRWDALWDRWDFWLNECSFPAAKVCINFVQSFNQIDRIVIGTDNLNQLRGLIEFSDYPLVKTFPDLRCDDENLINPSLWKRL